MHVNGLDHRSLAPTAALGGEANFRGEAGLGRGPIQPESRSTTKGGEQNEGLGNLHDDVSVCDDKQREGSTAAGREEESSSDACGSLEGCCRRLGRELLGFDTTQRPWILTPKDRDFEEDGRYVADVTLTTMRFPSWESTRDQTGLS